MRTESNTIKIYKFSELSETAKQKAIDDYRNLETEFYQAEFVFYDCKEVARIIGIDIDNIYYSGFCSQGDGACFEGEYQYKKGSVKAIKKYAPKDTELHDIALNLYKSQRKAFYRLSAVVRQRGHYYHELCTDITVYNNNEYANDETETDIKESLREFMQLIYSRLEKEYEYCNSDKYITENIENNEYEFLETGEMYW